MCRTICRLLDLTHPTFANERNRDSRRFINPSSASLMRQPSAYYDSLTPDKESAI